MHLPLTLSLIINILQPLCCFHLNQPSLTYGATSRTAKITCLVSLYHPIFLSPSTASQPVLSKGRLAQLGRTPQGGGSFRPTNPPPPPPSPPEIGPNTPISGSPPAAAPPVPKSHADFHVGVCCHVSHNCPKGLQLQRHAGAQKVLGWLQAPCVLRTYLSSPLRSHQLPLLPVSKLPQYPLHTVQSEQAQATRQASK